MYIIEFAQLAYCIHVSYKYMNMVLLFVCFYMDMVLLLTSSHSEPYTTMSLEIKIRDGNRYRYPKPSGFLLY